MLGEGTWQGGWCTGCVWEGGKKEKDGWVDCCVNLNVLLIKRVGWIGFYIGLGLNLVLWVQDKGCIGFDNSFGF